MVRTQHAETPAIDRTACPSRGRHGTRHHRYVNGCTCPDSAADDRRIRHRLRVGQEVPYKQVSAVGTMRRLQGAALHGLTLRRLSVDTHISRNRLVDYRRGARTRMSAENAEIVAQVVQRLTALPPPPEGESGPSQARAQARREGWRPLDSWADIDDPDDLPDDAYSRDRQAVIDPDAAAVAEFRELADAGLCLAELIERTGLDEHAVRDRLDNIADTDRRRSRRTLTADQVYAIRVDYVRTRATWSARDTARRHRVSRSLIDQVIRGTTRPELGLTDLTDDGTRAPRAARADGAPGRVRLDRIPPEVVHAVRADYVDAGLGYIRLGQRHGITRDAARRIVRGQVRTDLPLTDLTAHKRGDQSAATPTGGDNRKEDSAA